MQTQSIAKTQQAKKIMTRLCRHWAHKCEVELNENDALVQLPFGPCRIEANSQSIATSINVSDKWPVERAERMIESHLVRMAQKEELEVVWERQADSSSSNNEASRN